jgi:hypothetical protein
VPAADDAVYWTRVTALSQTCNKLADYLRVTAGALNSASMSTAS